MSAVSFIDTTLRDGPQSLWATRMTTQMMLPIASKMDQVGFEAIEVMGTTAFEVCVRYLGDNPWERIRLLRDRIRKTPITSIFRAQSFTSFGLVGDDVIELVVKRMAANGIDRISVGDGLNDLRNLEVAVRTGQDLGLHITGWLVFSIAPVFTDEYYTQKLKEILALGVDAVKVKDPSGLLTQDRVATLLPAMREAAPTIPIQIHSHCNSGLAPLCYLEAIRLGATSLHTASLPLANGSSLPATESVASNARRMGYAVDLDDKALEEIATHFANVAHEHH